jgi:hypothetical protein
MERKRGRISAKIEHGDSIDSPNLYYAHDHVMGTCYRLIAIDRASGKKAPLTFFN